MLGTAVALAGSVALALLVDAVVRAVSPAHGAPRVDTDVLHWMVDHRTGTWTDLMKAATAAGSVGTIAPVTVVVVIALLAMRQLWCAGYLVSVVVGASFVSGWAKALTGRARPPVATRLVDVTTSAFPSGHATQVAATAAALGVLVAVLVRSRITRVIAWILLGGITILVGLSRLYLGVHWTTDVLAGWLIGTTWALGAAYAFRPLAIAGLEDAPASEPG